MFQIVNSSVSIMMDDLEQAHIEKIFEQHEFRLFNLIEVVKQFGVPPGWELPMNYEATYWFPTTGSDVCTKMMHFERDEEWTPRMP